MANPFVNPLSKNVSKAPQEHATDPIPERYTGLNHAYRGVQNHGVDVAEYEYEEPTYHGDNDEEYETPEREIPPIAVRVVSEESREMRKVRFIRYRIPADNTVVQILGRDSSRTRATIHAIQDSFDIDSSVLISHSPDTLVSNSSMEITAKGAKNSFDTSTQDALYAIGHYGGGGTVIVQVEYVD